VHFHIDIAFLTVLFYGVLCRTPLGPSQGCALQITRLQGSTMRILVIGVTVLIAIFGRLWVVRQKEGCGCWMSPLSSW